MGAAQSCKRISASYPLAGSAPAMAQLRQSPQPSATTQLLLPCAAATLHLQILTTQMCRRTVPLAPMAARQSSKDSACLSSTTLASSTEPGSHTGGTGACAGLTATLAFALQAIAL